MAAFPTLTEVKSYQRNEKASVDDAFYAGALAAAIETLNDECKRQFIVAGTPTPRTFVPDGTGVIRTGDFVSATTIVENGVTLTVGNHYQLEPVNRFNASGVEVPYSSIRRLDTCWYANGLRGTVTVTAAWGWTTIPQRIVEACRIIAKDIISNRQVQMGLVAWTEAGAITARQNPIVRATIARYRGPKSWGIS